MKSPKVQSFASTIYSENYADGDKPYIDVREDYTGISLIYTVTLWNRTHLEKLIVARVFKQLSEFYETALPCLH
jgi:hypothetical protein